ncbi:MAG: zf-HC2 domain-containing protein, partial [Planctomycetes bacterium]|nr:zf-HC2 domain-containing protein [Planctomycetota bacterium]
MNSRDTFRTPACKAAEEALARIVTGEAGAREQEDFQAHISACPRCTRQLSAMLALTREVRGALTAAAARLG